MKRKKKFSAYLFKQLTDASDVYMFNECKKRVKLKIGNASKLCQHLQAKHKRQQDEFVYNLQIFQVIVSFSASMHPKKLYGYYVNAIFNL